MEREKDLEQEIEAAWDALGISKEDRETSEDPDCETLAQSIRISLQYERDQQDGLKEKLARVQAQCTEWRDIAFERSASIRTMLASKAGASIYGPSVVVTSESDVTSAAQAKIIADAFKGQDTRTRFFVTSRGDRSVGIWPSEAEVLMWMNPEADKEDLESVRAALVDCFMGIFDDPSVSAVTEKEVDAFEEEMDEIFTPGAGHG